MRISSLNRFCKSMLLRRFIQITTGNALPWQPTQTTCASTATPAGNILDLKYNYNSSSQTDNGNVMGITNNRDTTRSQSFAYDQVNRISTAQTSSTSGSNCWGETSGYDQWANLTNIGAVSGYSGCTQESLSVSAGTNNQLTATGYTYDALGNMLTDASNTYVFNAESEIKTAASVNYTYDGDGDRVEKSNGKIYWYGAGTEILDESDASGNFTDEYVFFAGKRIAHRSVSSNTIYYYAEDLLGTSRTLVQAGQTSLCYDADFYPFGGERDITTTCSQNYKFERKERDTETGNDDFGARYYSSRMGRWLSADWSAVPAPVPYANLSNPQTLNLYAMVRDNPETFADLDGHEDEGGFGDSGGSGGGDPATTASPASGTAQPQTSAPASTTRQETSSTNPVAKGAQVGAAVGAVVGAVVGGIIGAAGGGAVGTAVEPGGGTAVGVVTVGAGGSQGGAEIGAATGAAAGAAVGAMYSKADKAVQAISNHLATAAAHLGETKLGGPDKEPRGTWKDTLYKTATNIDKRSDQIANKNLSQTGHFMADVIRDIASKLP